VPAILTAAKNEGQPQTHKGDDGREKEDPDHDHVHLRTERIAIEEMLAFLVFDPISIVAEAEDGAEFRAPNFDDVNVAAGVHHLTPDEGREPLSLEDVHGQSRSSGS
jgi:hypothetical protein